MRDNYATMEKMSDLHEMQHDLEKKNPGFVVSQIPYEDFKITKFQASMEHKRMGEVEEGVKKKVHYNMEMIVVELLKLLDHQGDELWID